jgi:hypothetical protein
MVQQMREQQERDIISNYFNYGFTEETFKKYINQQASKFCDVARISMMESSQQDDDETSLTGEQVNKKPKMRQTLSMYE